MARDFRSLIGLRSGARTEDIELPNESGRVDPRLPKPKPKPDVYKALTKDAPEGYRLLKERLEELKRNR